MVSFLFRKPVVPILVETDVRMFGIFDLKNFEKLKKANLFLKKEFYKLIDGRGEGWSFYPKLDIISPLTTDKAWTKKKIIDLYNSFLEDKDEKNKFICKNLSYKKLSEIILLISESSLKKMSNKNNGVMLCGRIHAR